MRIPRSAIVLLVVAVAVIGTEALTRPPPAPTTIGSLRRTPRANERWAQSSAEAPAPRDLPPAEVPAAPEQPPAPRPAPAPDEPPDLILTRIVRDDSDPEASFAVVSGRAVRAGDRIGGLRVADIGRDRVLLDSGRELTLNPDKEED